MFYHHLIQIGCLFIHLFIFCVFAFWSYHGRRCLSPPSILINLIWIIFGSYLLDLSTISLEVLVGSLLAAPFILALLYVVLLPCYKILVQKFSSDPLSPKNPNSDEELRLLKVRAA